MNVRKTATAAALAAVLGASSAANALTIDGITFEAGALFETIDLFEGELLGDGNGNDNKLIDQVGEELVGVGIVNRIRDANNVILWENGDNGRELVFHFYGYIAEQFNILGASLGEILFSGGNIDLYSQAAGTFGGVVSNNQATDIATATSGNLWMSLTGSPIGGQVGGNDVTLRSINIGTNPFTGVANVTGTGLLDVVAGSGPAAANFDTDTKGCVALEGAPCPDDADISFTSSGQIDPNATSAWGFGGTGEVRAFAVPVPGTLALLGLGLAGLGMRASRKAKA